MQMGGVELWYANYHMTICKLGVKKQIDECRDMQMRGDTHANEGPQWANYVRGNM